MAKKMSYYVSRIQAVLEYSAVASFNTKEEYVVGDLFIFIKEYCDKLIKNEEIEIETIIEENSYFPLRFVPQDIIIIVDNVISNSVKNGANHLKIVLAYGNEEAKIDFIDDGKGLDSNIIDIDELFEFGKGFTSTGTGVGLYHIKDITVNKLNGSVSILSEPDSGFTLQIRIRG